MVFLQTVGYSHLDIEGLGDLAAVSPEKMSELLRRKALEAVARSLSKTDTRVQVFRKKPKTKR